MKKCPKCNSVKSLSEFSKDRRTRLGVRVYCKICSKINPENRKKYNKSYQLKSLYGITKNEFEKLKANQNYCCAICNKQLDDSFGTHVDHCHKTNVIRGVLCRSCNIGLGHLNDSIEILKSAVKYLKKYNLEIE
jgi:Recombination endonuclease VII